MDSNRRTEPAPRDEQRISSSPAVTDAMRALLGTGERSKQKCESQSLWTTFREKLTLHREFYLWKHASQLSLNRYENKSVIVIVIHTPLWHRFKSDPWGKLCYVYRMDKTLWGRKSLADYTATSRRRNSEFWDYVSNNEPIASIQRVTLE